jgi:hypothetical protein
MMMCVVTAVGRVLLPPIGVKSVRGEEEAEVMHSGTVRELYVLPVGAQS